MNRIKFLLRNVFGISKTEANGLVILLPLTLLVILLPLIYNALIYSLPDTEEDGRQLNEVLAEWEQKAAKKEDFQPKLKPFDPNQISGDELIAMGLHERVAHNWQKYLQSGGHFYDVEDVRKIYGIEDSMYQDLSVYIRIPKASKKAGEEPEKLSEESSSYESTRAKPYERKYVNAPTPFDINMADTTDLKKIRGIGSVFSKRIVKYRESLGGFIDKKQLGEVYGLKESLLNHLDSLTFIGTDYPIRYLNINEVTEDQLAHHPYLTRGKAGAIISYRYQHGAFGSLNELYNIHLMDSLTITKISPYLKL
ncbi:hypothetical protein C900_05506 [Fulvivirga imtechensis AK7]|uniref:Helix-hairpin-helix domain-containing protein n=1 Tax=Fulvivirga imtechensis AK7 TaxID=1237149 RepID=L8JP07_9BACT|nr:helix-hairpin-helix domain-containing protein [Fulvivirga imtechensis]ELR69117.1 hypothetical protein C900_05506 [Fulvivirga imtechensis AK7]